MSVLLIETAGSMVGVGLALDDGTVAVRLENGARRHNEVLAPMIAAILGDPAARHHLTTVAVDVGPGLFTGLRVGIATAQALAFGLGRSAVALRSTELVASAAQRAGVRGSFAAVIDARRGEVYLERFVLDDHEVASVDDWPIVCAVDLAIAMTAEDSVLGGNGADLLGDLGARALVIRELEEDALRAGLELAAARAARGVTCAPAGLHALYLRDADARSNFETREHPRP